MAEIKSIQIGSTTYDLRDDTKVVKNTAITAGTNCKITYDAKGLVTAGAALTASDIPNLSADKITSGTLGTDRIPSLAASKITSGTFDAARIPNLAASKINSGTFDTARIPSLAADKINSGTFDIARIPTGTGASQVALGNHTHSITLATDTGTPAITLSHNTTYKLTAGGSAVIFKLPSDSNTNYYHTPSYSSGLKIGTGTGVNDMYVPNGSTTAAGVLQIGTGATNAAAGNHSHTVFNGLRINTQTDTTPLVIARSGTSGTDETVKYNVNDSVHNIYYVNDETSSAIKWTLVNTDTEGSTGVNASTHTMQVSASKTSVSLTLDGTAVSMAGHTHSYAGSSSAGGAATSANKLNTNAGSTLQPVYFSNGVPVATSYSVAKSVPADAKFTDTTYTAATTSTDGLMSSTDKSKLNSIAVSTGTTKSVTVGSDTLTFGSNAFNSTTIPTTYAGSSSAGGVATSAAKLSNTSKVGDTNKPVYFTANGVPAAISYTIEKSVPSDAKFTDTTYSNASTTTAGLMSAADKTKLNGIVVTNTSGTKSVTDGTSTLTFGSNAFNSTTIPTTYAGSSSAGGAATSANKINTDAGSTIQPVYFSNGVPVATSYSVAKSVPSDAKFTDTNTWRNVKVDGTEKLGTGTGTGALNFVSQNTNNGDVSFTYDGGIKATAKLPTFATVATSGLYSDLSGTPTIPTVNNSVITIKQTGISDQTFTLNGSAKTITLVDTNTWRPLGSGASDAAAGNHTHSLTLATDTGTAAITLAHNTTYKLTAGGSSLIFKTASDSNTNYYHTPSYSSGLKIATGTGVNDLYVPAASTTTAGTMSASDKVKLNGIATGAEVNVQSNWNQTDTTADDYIKNKPTIPATNVIPTTTTGDKLLVSTTTSGTAKWSNWSSAGFLKTNASGVISIDTNSYLTTSGTAADSSKLNGQAASYYQVALPTTTTAGKVLKSTSTAGTVEWGSDSNTNTWRNIKVNGTQQLGTGTNTGALDFVSQDTNNGDVSFTYDGGIKATAKFTHQSIKTLNTTATTTQSTNASEAIKGSGTITLHKVSKTGKYSDLIGTPTLKYQSPDYSSGLKISTGTNVNSLYIPFATEANGQFCLLDEDGRSVSVAEVITHITTCFRGDTSYVTMYDGTTKLISEVKAGDSVLGYDVNKQDYCEAIVLDNLRTGEANAFDCYVFEDGTTIDIYGDDSFLIHFLSRFDDMESDLTDCFSACGIKYLYTRSTEKKEHFRKIIKSTGGKDEGVAVIYKQDFYCATPTGRYCIDTSNGTCFINGLCQARKPINMLNRLVKYHKTFGPKIDSVFAGIFARYAEGADDLIPDDHIEDVSSAALLKELNENSAVIEMKKNYLNSTDYKATKYAEGALSEEEWLPIKAKRAEARTEINNMEARNAEIIPILKEANPCLMKEYGDKYWWVKKNRKEMLDFADLNNMLEDVREYFSQRMS